MNDVGKTMWSRNYEKRGIVTKESERYCAVCGRHSCYIVKWEDGRVTKPCTKAVIYEEDGDLKIE